MINEAARIFSFLQTDVRRNHLPFSTVPVGFCSVRAYMFTPEILLEGLSPVLLDAFALKYLFCTSLTESLEIDRKLSLLLILSEESLLTMLPVNTLWL